MATPVSPIRIGVDEARAIAMDAYVYGFPIVDNYRVQYSYFVDRAGPEYRAAFNTLFNSPRLPSPDDRGARMPNADMVCSWVGADLRTEPLVLTLPSVKPDRYVSLQLVDMYTYNFGYGGTRTTGNDATRILLAGPRWQGTVPPVIRQVFRCESEFACAIYHTQVLDPGDFQNVRDLQAGYRAQTLSDFLGAPSPTPALPLEFVQPLDFKAERRSLEFFNVLNFLLAFCPTHRSETGLIDRFVRIGIGPSKRFDAAVLPKETRDAIEYGVADAWMAFEHHKRTQVDTGKLFRADMFGTRDMLKNNYLQRMSSAALGIYGPSREESVCFPLYTDRAETALDGSNSYALRFAAGKHPPVHGFWSVTLYELPAGLLYANPLNRYLISSAMQPRLAPDADGGLTLDVQHEPPAREREANWLPAPAGEFCVVIRLYWPKAEALDGRWQAPLLERRESAGVES